jgi:hypothetical protein
VVPLHGPIAGLVGTWADNWGSLGRGGSFKGVIFREYTVDLLQSLRRLGLTCGDAEKELDRYKQGWEACRTWEGLSAALLLVFFFVTHRCDFLCNVLDTLNIMGIHYPNIPQLRWIIQVLSSASAGSFPKRVIWVFAGCLDGLILVMSPIAVALLLPNFPFLMIIWIHYLRSCWEFRDLFRNDNDVRTKSLNRRKPALHSYRNWRLRSESLWSSISIAVWNTVGNRDVSWSDSQKHRFWAAESRPFNATTEYIPHMISIL